MNGSYWNTIINCKQCNELFAQIWTDQELCPECKPLIFDPMKLELARHMSESVWNRYPR